MEDFGNLLEEILSNHNEKIKDLEEKLVQIFKENEKMEAESKKEVETFELHLSSHNKNYRKLAMKLMDKERENFNPILLTQSSTEAVTDMETQNNGSFQPEISTNNNEQHGKRENLQFSSTALPFPFKIVSNNAATTSPLQRVQEENPNIGKKIEKSIGKKSNLKRRVEKRSSSKSVKVSTEIDENSSSPTENAAKKVRQN